MLVLRLSSLLLVAALLSLAAGPREARADLLTKVLSINELSVIDGLTGVNFLHLSPDDRFVFATALDDQSIASYQRNPVTGALGLGDVERDNVGGVDGIDTPGDPGVDASGRHIYVPGSGEDALAVFTVATDGALGFVEAQREGFSGVTGLDAPAVARVSPDGAFVYAAGTTAVAIFERDLVTGALDWVAQQIIPGGFGDTLSMEIAPDGSTVYVGTNGDALLAYARSAATGLLTLVDTEDATTAGVSLFVVSMAPSRDGRFVYASAGSSVVVFTRASNGTLSFAQTSFAGSLVRVALAADGRGVWTSTVDVGGVVPWVQDFLPIDSGTGLLGAKQRGIFQAKNMQNGRIAPSRDGRHLYVSDAANDGQGGFPDGPPVIDVLSVKPLAYVEKQGDGVAGVNGLDGAYSVALSPDGRHVYVAGVVDDAVAVFSRDATTGALAFVEAEIDGAAGVDGLDGATHVTLSPDGKSAYVCGFEDDAVAVFSRNASTGALTFVERQKDGVGAVAGLDSAAESAVSRDGKHLYVVSSIDDTVTAFSRNTTTGALTFVEERREGVAGVSGLNGANSVEISPAGGHVYVASNSPGSIAVFTRNPTTGALGFVESHIDGGSSTELGAATGVAVSRDGRHVYVVAFTDRSISTFEIGAGGTLTWLGALNSTDGLIEGLDFPSFVGLTADDRHIVVASAGAISVFRRDPETGELGYAQAEFDTGIDGLGGSGSVAASPDGRHVYVTGPDDDALVVFAPEPGATGLMAAAAAALIALRRKRALSRS